MKIVWLLGISIIIFFLSFRCAHAFSISPTRYLITANPGTGQIVRLYVKNDEGVVKTFKIFVAGLKQENGGAVIFQQGLDIAEMWVTAGQKELKLEPGVGKQVDFVIDVPENTPPGSHYLGLAAETNPDATSGSVIGSRLFAILTLRVAGEAYESVSIDRWSGPKLVFNSSWPMVLHLNNNGNIDIPLNSRIEISYFGNIIDKIDWSLGNNLLAFSARHIERRISPTLVWPGRYEARNNIMYGRSGQAVMAVYNVWYFPVWSIVACIAMVIVFIFIYIKLAHRHVES